MTRLLTLIFHPRKLCNVVKLSQGRCVLQDIALISSRLPKVFLCERTKNTYSASTSFNGQESEQCHMYYHRTLRYAGYAGSGSSSRHFAPFRHRYVVLQDDLQRGLPTSTEEDI